MLHPLVTFRSTCILTGKRDPARLQWCAARQTAQPDATSVLGAWHQADAEGGRVPPQGHHTPPLRIRTGPYKCPSFCQLVVAEGAQRRALDRVLFLVMSEHHAAISLVRTSGRNPDILIPWAICPLRVAEKIRRPSVSRRTSRSLPMYYN